VEFVCLSSSHSRFLTRVFTLFAGPIDDCCRALAFLADDNKVSELSLRFLDMSPEALRDCLRNLSQLRKLSFHIDWDYVSFPEYPRRELLSEVAANVSSNLDALSIFNCFVTDFDIFCIESRLRKLTKLSLEECSIFGSYEIGPVLASLENLEELRLIDCAPVTDRTIIKSVSKKLRVLELVNLKSITGKAVARILSRNKGLQTLNLSGCSFAVSLSGFCILFG